MTVAEAKHENDLPMTREVIRETLAKQLKLLSERSALVGSKISNSELVAHTEAMCSVSEILIRTLPLGQ